MPVDLTTLAQIPASAVRLLWVNDWFDGPREAVVEHGGERCLLVPHDPDAVAREVPPYRWLLYRLEPERLREEERWHALFVHHVGDHWCFHPETPHAAEPGDRDPRIFQAAIAERRPLPVEGEAPLGWLDQMPTS